MAAAAAAARAATAATQQREVGTRQAPCGQGDGHASKGWHHRASNESSSTAAAASGLPWSKRAPSGQQQQQQQHYSHYPKVPNCTVCKTLDTYTDTHTHVDTHTHILMNTDTHRSLPCRQPSPVMRMRHPMAQGSVRSDTPQNPHLPTVMNLCLLHAPQAVVSTLL